jgi:hypothetical protein
MTVLVVKLRKILSHGALNVPIQIVKLKISTDI